MLTPLPAEDWDDRARDALAETVAPERRNPDDAGNALATLVRHPDLARKFLTFNGYLLSASTLPARLRELVILRTAHHHSCDYEWVHHVAIGKREGLTDAEVTAARTGSAADDFDRCVLRAVDELHAQSRVTAATWSELGERLDDQQRMDLVFTAGCYGMLAMGLNTFGVVPEEDAGQPEFYAD